MEDPRHAHGRLAALSDGVFAIALTLIALNVRIDQRPHESFNHALKNTIPPLWAYGLSFAVIAVFWIAHRRLFAVLDRVDHPFVLINFVFLAIVALIPFPSQALGENSDEVGAVVLYATWLSAGGLTNFAQWWYARRAGLVDSSVPPSVLDHSMGRALGITCVFGASIPVALLAGPAAAMWTWFAVIPARLILRRHYGNIHDAAW